MLNNSNAQLTRICSWQSTNIVRGQLPIEVKGHSSVAKRHLTFIVSVVTVHPHLSKPLCAEECSDRNYCIQSTFHLMHSEVSMNIVIWGFRYRITGNFRGRKPSQISRFCTLKVVAKVFSTKLARDISEQSVKVFSTKSYFHQIAKVFHFEL